MLVERLAKQSGVPLARLIWLQDNASKLYKTYEIPKRSGGTRKISQPTPELKSIQRWIVKYLSRFSSVSKAATAYQKGTSIRKNALIHAGTSFTAHFDFEDFFPSFTDVGIMAFLVREAKLPELDALYISKVVTRLGRMTIGAPSSPVLSNLMMRSFDESLLAWCEENELEFSRYADDMNISSHRPFALKEARSVVSKLAHDFPYAELKLNDSKTAYLSRKYRRTVTGVTLTPDGEVSIGRDRKRYIKHLLHQFAVGNLDAEELWHAGGLVAFAIDVEPAFATALERKYGKALVDKLLHRSSGKQ